MLKNCDIIGLTYKWNNSVIAPEIKPQDEEALKSLYKLEYQTTSESANFSLLFYFNENEYFQGDVIKKDFLMKDD